MAKPRVKITGGDTLVSNLRIVARKYPQVAASALFEEADVRLRAITIPLTPLGEVNGGTLRGSFFVNSPIKTVRGPRVVVGFGGAAAAYAVAQHEGPGSKFAPPSWSGKTVLSYTESGTGPKFLEKAVQELRKNHLAQLRKRIAAKVARIQLRTG